MSGISKTCASELANIGSLSCTKNNPFMDVVSLIVVKAGFTFDTIVKFATLSEWQKGIREKKITPIHEIIEIDDNSEEAQYYESPTGFRLPRRLGKYRHLYKFNKSLTVHKALQSFRNANVDVYLADSAGNVMGYSPDGTKVRGFSVAMFNPEKMTSPMQDGTPAWTPIAVDQLDAKEWNEKGVAVKVGWLINELQPVTSVKISVVSAAVAEIVAKVVYIDGTESDGTDNEVGISGILQTDFVFTTTAPTAAAMIDNGDGTYKFPGANMVTGSVDLKSPATAESTGDPIESTGPAVITIV